MEGDIREQVQVVHEEVTAVLGPGVVADGAQAGSKTHRVSEILDKRGERGGAAVSPVVNGETSVAAGGGHSGARKNAGTNDASGSPGAEPTALERELAMGFMEDVAAHPEVTEAERRKALGRAMDLNVMHWHVAMIQMYHSQLPCERKRGKAAVVRPSTERSAAKEALARAMMGEIKENDDMQHEQGHPVERRWMYPWEKDDEVPAQYAKQVEIRLPGEQEEAAMDKKREDFSKLEEAIERQCRREIYEREFGSLEFAHMAAMKGEEGEGMATRRVEDGTKKSTARQGATAGASSNQPEVDKEQEPLQARIMDRVLRDVKNAACYIDNVIVFSTDSRAHVKDVEAGLKAIHSAGFTCHPVKCKFGQTTVEYLGFEVEGGRIGIQKAKVEVLDRVATPKDRSALRALLGFLNYYRKFVPNFSSQETVLNQLLREGCKWEWGTEQEKAVQDLMGQ
ncbi:unnamed protein product [Closterium sp. NIES-53]